MLDQEMRLLDSRDVGVRYRDDDVGLQRATPCAGQRDRAHATRASRLERRDDVLRGPARGDRDEDVAGPAERLNLTCENTIEAKVVRDGGQRRRVGCQGYRRQPASIPLEPADELACDMLSVSGTATVPAEQDLATAGQRTRHLRDRSLQCVAAGAQQLCVRLLGAADRILERVSHFLEPPRSPQRRRRRKCPPY